MSTEVLLISLLCSCVFGWWDECCGFFSSTALPISHIFGGQKLLPASSVSSPLSVKKSHGIPRNVDELIALQNYPLPEFSRPFSLRQLGSDSREVYISANATERALLARRFKLQDIKTLSATFIIERSSLSDLVTAKLQLETDYLQLCARTSKPILRSISKDIQTVAKEIQDDECNVAGGGKTTIAFENVLWDDDEEEEPTSLEVEEWDEYVSKDGHLDLGEIAAQYLALSIDRFTYIPETDSTEIELPPG